MKRSVQRAAASALFVAGAASCSLDLDNLTGEGVASDAGAVDATVDVNAPEAAPIEPADVGADVAAPVDASPDAEPAIDAADAATDSACVQTMSDPLNCGTCGHSCLGGTCSGGSCAPVTLAPGPVALVSPLDLTVDDETVFFTDTDLSTTADRYVYAVPKHGGACATASCYPTPLWSGRSPAKVATDTVNVYVTSFASPGAVTAINKLSGAAVRLTSTESFPYAVAVDSTSVYWTSYGQSFSQGTVSRIALDAGPDASVTTIAFYGSSGISLLSDIAVSDTNVYWSESVAGGYVRYYPKNGSGGGTANLFGGGGQAFPRGLAVAQSSLVWTQGTGADASAPGQVQRAGLQGGCPNGPCPLASGVVNPFAVTADQSFVYISTAGVTATHADGQILRVGLDGTCPASATTCPEVIASGQLHPSSITHDESAIYWVNRGTTSADGTSHPNSDGAIMKLAK